MGGAVDMLDRIFSRPTGLAARIAGVGMGLVNRSALARRFFFRQAAA
jgi:hypothetical protein